MTTTGTLHTTLRTPLRTTLRAALLSGYDRHVPPKSTRTDSYSAAGTEVKLDVRIFKVIAVNPSKGLMQIKVWLRMQWVDQRLMWDPKQHGNLTLTHMWSDTRPTGAGPELWTPDIQPWNAYTSMSDTLDPVPTIIYSDGSVYHSRPGTLDIMCRFSGLAAFPFDTLKCGMSVNVLSTLDTL